MAKKKKEIKEKCVVCDGTGVIHSVLQEGHGFPPLKFFAICKNCSGRKKVDWIDNICLKEHKTMGIKFLVINKTKEIIPIGKGHVLQPGENIVGLMYLRNYVLHKLVEDGHVRIVEYHWMNLN